MPTKVKPSDKTKELIAKFAKAHPSSNLNLPPGDEKFDITQLTNWLNKKNDQNEGIFIIESLRASLLKDIFNSLPGTIHNPEPDKSNLWYKKALYIGLAIAGTLLVGCEGFDGITAMLGIFALPQAIVLAAGAIFSILSIAVFYGFDLMEISNNLGVSFRESRNILNVYIQQLEQIGLIQKKLNQLTKGGNPKSDDELKESLQIIGALNAQLDSLEDARNKFEIALNNKFLRFGKLGVALVTGVMFFSGGYFAGQAVASTLAAAIVGAPVAATAWPIIVAALCIGVAAFAIYWFVERPGVQNLIGRIVGLDQEKVDKFSDEKGIEDLRHELRVNEANIKGMFPASITSQIRSANDTIQATTHPFFKPANSLSQNGSPSMNLSFQH